MLKACRTCLGLIDVDILPFYEIEADDVQLSTESCRYKLLNLIPEMALNITPKSMICFECHGSLEALFEFKAKCLKTEKIITQYFQAKPALDIKTLDLKDVLAFSMNCPEDDKKKIEDEAVEALVVDVAIKEEAESSDVDFAAVDESITIVKHDVDNFSSESVVVVKPENTALESKEEGSFKCQVCSKSFPWRSRLESHMLSHSDVKEHDCERCGKKFSTSKTLRIHMKIHVEDRNFACEYCDKRYSDGSLLKRHLVSHTKPYHCEICDNRFGQKTHLKMHMLKHTGNQYICTVCCKSFDSKDNLKVHKCTGLEEQQYQCDKCQKKFTVQSSLRRHMVMHATQEQSSFSCRICRKTFNRNYDFKRHVMKMHKDINIEPCNTNVVDEIKEGTQER